jgi:hypothetical protein
MQVNSFGPRGIPNMSRVWTTIITVVAIISIAGNILLYYRYSTGRPLVRFNDSAITKKQYMDMMELQYGKAVLQKMLLARLVLDAAQKVNLLPSSDQIDARMAEIERRTPQVTAAARQDPLKMEMLKEDLKTDVCLENLRMRGVTATDAELADFYDKHKTAFVLPPQIDTTMVLAQNDVDANTAATDLQQGLAADVIARQPRLKVLGVNGVRMDMRAIPPSTSRAITQAISKMKLNEVKTVRFSDAFLVIKVIRLLPGGLPPLAQIHDEVLRDVRLSKAPAMGAVMAQLYKDSNPRFDNEKYRVYFADYESYNAKK